MAKVVCEAEVVGLQLTAAGECNVCSKVYWVATHFRAVVNAGALLFRTKQNQSSP